MKKILILCVLLVLALTACNHGGVQKTTNTTNNTTTTETTYAETSSSNVLHTLPKNIIINDSYRKEVINVAGFDPLYRECYYRVGGGFFIELVDNDEFNEFTKMYGEENPPGQEKKEMLAKAFVEHFDIPKEKFEEAVQKSIAFRLKRGNDISLEDYEIPNPDIIYTFDDAIINDYYRRDKGVKPTETQSSVTE